MESGRESSGSGARGLSGDPGRGERLPAFFYRLSSKAQRCYLTSDSIDRFEFVPDSRTTARVDSLLTTLESGSLPALNQAAQALIDEICRQLAAPAVRAEIRGVRPRDRRRELHGIFYPSRRHMIVWMRTAQRHEVVRPKTFLRTLLHELGHYLDYSVLKLEDSYHTQGFFRRESFLVRALYNEKERGENGSPRRARTLLPL